MRRFATLINESFVGSKFRVRRLLKRSWLWATVLLAAVVVAGYLLVPVEQPPAMTLLC